VKHAALALVALAFWPMQGTTHGWLFSTIMLTAIYRDYQTTRA
jgi:hypothetical protein